MRVRLIIAVAIATAFTVGAFALGIPGGARAAETKDLCAITGAEWKKGVVTQYPWKVISSRNGFEVKRCIVRDTPTKRHEAIVRFTNTSPAPVWLKVRTFYVLSSGRQVDKPSTITLVKPGEFTSQSLPLADTKPGEEVRELGFHEMLVSPMQPR